MYNPAVKIPDIPVIFWDMENPKSVFNLCPDPLQLQLKNLQKSELCYLLDLVEPDLFRALQKLNHIPNMIDNRLRVKFWMEYDRCYASGDRKVNISTICAGVCSRETFYKYFITRVPRLAWLLCPPQSYTAKIEEAIQVVERHIDFNLLIQSIS